MRPEDRPTDNCNNMEKTMQDDDAGEATTLNGVQQENNLKREARRLAEFYEDKRILITGSTGFIGKVFLAKLIGSLGNYGQVFVMLRPKRGQSAQQRMDKMLAEEPFLMTRAKAPQADRWSRVTAIEGNMSSENLGLSREDHQRVCQEVDVIFNIAASVRFDATLKDNLRDNYMGVSNLMQLATKLQRLTSLVHVSTFYTNFHISHIREQIVAMNSDCEMIAQSINLLPDELIDQISPKLLEIENRPNSYIYTKAMAENLVEKYQSQLPIAIVRPSIVIPSIRDPVEGWVDNINGLIGMATLGSIGILRTVDWNYYGVADLIPVDVVANTMLAVAERTTRMNNDAAKRSLLVYNCSSSYLNPIIWGESLEIVRRETLKAPPYKLLRIPIEPPRHRRANRFMFKFTKLTEILFALFFDFVLMLCGQKRILTKLTARLHHAHKIMKPFTCKEFTCSNDNLVAAYNELHSDDRKEFNFDVRAIDWKTALKNCYLGLRMRILKEDMTNKSAALYKLRIHFVVETILRLTSYATVLWLIFRLFYSQFVPFV